MLLAGGLNAGCSTISREGEQLIDVVVRDLDGRQIAARCTVQNFSGTLVGNAPMFRIPVDRSVSDINIECQPAKGQPVARATVVSHSVNRLSVLVQPTAATVIDALSGRLFDYPERIILVSGRARVFDLAGRGGEPSEDKAIPISNIAGQAPVVGN